jgi:hypothetical protein
VNGRAALYRSTTMEISFADTGWLLFRKLIMPDGDSDSFKAN